ncbi:GmrSD restriction endonuclease domain-containing protein [Streptosporangium sp. NBC_01756]|uniref:GmrSD restriction endonuclease domain-containing protein n=1 Tax=Streptosporangium sp. NBC_01756 TaxID=2975950 RepID=UPI002DDBB83F|nr:DUF262 domain-containing protein [Streptosporangium sp. NBC_01756]WSC88582.1 DUF262 domain-containing protein [Streptosporangium sp. NBC_01756]
MKANETTLRDLISRDHQFLVPLYQRPYAWEREQLGRLWSDIERQADGLRKGEDAGHFLGSVVLAPAFDNAPGHSRWLVVDGQQRLTTLLLALCALRDYQAAEDPLHRDRINDLHLLNKYKSGDMRYRLLPTQVDREAFKACVEDLPYGGTDSRVGSAYQFFRDRLRQVDDPADPHDITRVEEVVLDRLTLVQIVVEKDDNAFRIFESINNTGMRLSQVDLIRNHVFMHLPTRDQYVYDTYWRPMHELLGAKGMDQLMYLTLVLELGDDAQYNDTYRGHQEILAAAAADGEAKEERVTRYVKDLARRSRYLHRILNPEKDGEIEERLRFLIDWKGSTAYPLVMRLLELADDGQASDDEVGETLRYIESFLVRRLVAGVATGNLNRIFMRLTRDLTGDEPVADTVRTALSSARLYWSSDEQFRRDIRQRAFYWQGRTAQQKLVLRRLEEAYGSKEPVDVSDKEITIEHVLPQSPTAEWLEQLVSEGDAELAHKELVHTLGNLTLSGYNSELGNMSFARKRDFLARSGLTMNQEIARQERWGRAEILARADALADWAIEIWPSPVDVGPAGPSRDWSLLHAALSALPPGTWTTYGDLAELTGSHARPVAAHLASREVLNAHRVLSAPGSVSSGFHWPDENDDRDVHDVLRAEGIKLDESGKADPTQRVSARELAELLGLPGAEDLSEADLSAVDLEDSDEWERRFFQQLGEASGPQVAGAVSRVLDHWRARGGEVQFGRSAGASCAPIVRRGGDQLHAFRFYADSVSVPFGTLKKREPFKDPALREELRQLLNASPGVDIPAAKLELYPSFKATLLANEAVWDVVVGCLDWFAAQVEVE